MGNSKQNRHFAGLRSAAEKIIKGVGLPGNELSNTEIDAVIQELQVHQIELELQNDELLIVSQEAEIQRLKFENIYDLAPVGYFILDLQGIIEEVNAAGMALIGSGKSIVKGKPLITFIAPDERDNFHVFFKHLLRSDFKHRQQFKFVTRNGQEFYGLLEARVVPVTSKCYLAVIDVTEGIESRSRLAEASERLQLALQASASGIWELNYPSMQFYLDKINHRICNITAFANTYSSFIELVHPDDRFIVDQHFRKAVNNETEIDIVSRFINAEDHVCFASIRGHLVVTDVGKEKRFVGIISDITEKKNQEALAELEKSTRLREIAVATLQAEERERKRISEALHNSVSQLLYGIKIHMGQLNDADKANGMFKLNQLLDMTIKETRNISFELAPATLTDFGLPTTINELCERLSSPKMNITAMFSGFSTRKDPLFESTVFRVVQELVNNCMKHSGASQVSIQLKHGKQIELIVADNGKGMPEAKSDRQTKGTGLISIKNRIQHYQGTLDIKTAPDQGTTIIVKLKSNG